MEITPMPEGAVELNNTVYRREKFRKMKKANALIAIGTMEDALEDVLDGEGKPTGKRKAAGRRTFVPLGKGKGPVNPLKASKKSVGK